MPLGDDGCSAVQVQPAPPGYCIIYQYCIVSIVVHVQKLFELGLNSHIHTLLIIVNSKGTHISLAPHILNHQPLSKEISSCILLMGLKSFHISDINDVVAGNP